MFKKIIFALLFFSLSLSALQSDLPLSVKSFKESAKSFKEMGFSNYLGLELPEGIVLKSKLLLSLKNIENSFIEGSHKVLYRKSMFNILAPKDGQNTFSGRTKKTVKVGSLVFIENASKKMKIEGQFTLHFIEIYDAYKGHGYGSTALDLAIAFAQALNAQSSFYNQLTLQCSDFCGDQHLGDVPFRLSYYLNHGFTIDHLTKSFLQQLDSNVFVESLHNEEFDSFLNYYLADDKDLGQYLKNSEEILSLWKQGRLAKPRLSFEALLQIAESNSSKAGQRVLDRLFYSRSISEEFFQTKCGGYIFLLHLNLNDWAHNLNARKLLKSERSDAHSVQNFNLNEDEDLRDEIREIYRSSFEAKENEIEKASVLRKRKCEPDYSSFNKRQKKVEESKEIKKSQPQNL